MTSLKQQVETLVSQVDAYLNDALTNDQLEQCTMEIIAHDDFGQLPNGVQDVIYTLDNRGLNKLTKEEIVNLRDELDVYAHDA